MNSLVFSLLGNTRQNGKSSTGKSWGKICNTGGSGSFQINIRATDGGTPPLVSEQIARVRVTVTRNANAPKFQGNPPFNATVNENQAPNTKIFEVRATDADPEGPFKTLTFRVIGDDTAPTYFTANENGDILVRRNMQETSLENFSVIVTTITILYYFT